MRNTTRITTVLVLALATVSAVMCRGSVSDTIAQAQGERRQRYFAETGRTVSGPFLRYWEQNGGLEQQGYPISDELQEFSDIDGRLYRVQYFERAVFEYHEDNEPPYNVLLSLLGRFEYHKRYGQAGAPGQRASTDDPVLFPETGKTLGGKFRAYWQQNGGLAQQGYPISDEFQELSALDGKYYTVQYFERAVFELHPENAGTPYEVLLSQLGRFRYHDVYIVGQPRLLAIEGLHRSSLRASNRYLVWAEEKTLSSSGAGQGTSDILAFNLETFSPLLVSEGEPHDQTSLAISESIAVWQSQGENGAGGHDYVMGRDLDTGQKFQVSTGPAASRYPAIAGESVAWIEFDEGSTRLLGKNIGAAEAEIIRVARGISFGPPAISDKYIIWSELNFYGRNDPAQPSFVKALDRRSGLTRVVEEFLINPYSGGMIPEYALDDHRLFLTGSRPRILDLSNGEVTPFGSSGNMLSPVLRGDIAIWSSRSEGVYGDAGGRDVWGINVRDFKGGPLVIGPGDQRGVIAGNRLAWVNDEGGPYEGGIGIMLLDTAFATIKDRVEWLAKP